MRCVDLFCGCGGLSSGFSQAGYEVVLGIDKWKKALNIYKKNFSHKALEEDITNEERIVASMEQFNPEIIIGGPPCQDFSSAGKRDVTRGQADLTYHYTNVVCSYKPKYFLMENVDRIVSSYVLKDVINQFSNNGYGLTTVILNAAYCNVPQSRLRFFLIGGLNFENNFLLPILKKNLNTKEMTIRDYLGNSLGINYYYRHPRNYNRRGIFSIDEPSPTIRGVNRPIPPGYKINSCDPQNIDLSDIRPLTTRERSFIQTFPRDFIFEGNKTDLEQIIGNAVPVNLAKFVAESLKEYINNPIFYSENLFNDLIIPSKYLTKEKIV
ncbi:MAG: DNA cytosine methyltransferase [Treponema sp.]